MTTISEKARALEAARRKSIKAALDFESARGTPGLTSDAIKSAAERYIAAAKAYGDVVINLWSPT